MKWNFLRSKLSPDGPRMYVTSDSTVSERTVRPGGAGGEGGCSLGLSRVGSYPLNANLVGLVALPKSVPHLSSAKTPDP